MGYGENHHLNGLGDNDGTGCEFFVAQKLPAASDSGAVRKMYGGCFWHDAYLGTMDEVSHSKSSVSARSLSDAHGIAIKVVERQIPESSRPKFVQRLLDILKQGDRHLFAKQKRLDGIGMPMHACDVAPPRNV
jgi:hypothetical protein